MSGSATNIYIYICVSIVFQIIYCGSLFLLQDGQSPVSHISSASSGGPDRHLPAVWKLSGALGRCVPSGLRDILRCWSRSTDRRRHVLTSGLRYQTSWNGSQSRPAGHRLLGRIGVVESPDVCKSTNRGLRTERSDERNEGPRTDRTERSDTTNGAPCFHTEGWRPSLLGWRPLTWERGRFIPCR